MQPRLALNSQSSCLSPLNIKTTAKYLYRLTSTEVSYPEVETVLSSYGQNTTSGPLLVFVQSGLNNWPGLLVP